MSENSSIEESEFIDYLSLQMDSYQYLQDKAGSYIRYSIGIAALFVGLLSTGDLNLGAVFSMDKINDSIVGLFIYTSSDARILTILFIIILMCVVFFVTITLMIAYLGIFHVYREFQTRPIVLDRKNEVNLVENSASKRFKRQKLLNKNNEFLISLRQHLSDASKWFLIAGFGILYLGFLLMSFQISSPLIVVLVFVPPVIWTGQLWPVISSEDGQGLLDEYHHFKKLFKGFFARTPEKTLGAAWLNIQIMAFVISSSALITIGITVYRIWHYIGLMF